MTKKIYALMLAAMLAVSMNAFAATESNSCTKPSAACEKKDDCCKEQKECCKDKSKCEKHAHCEKK